GDADLALVVLGEVTPMRLPGSVRVEEGRQLGPERLLVCSPLELHGRVSLVGSGDERRDAALAVGEELVAPAFDLVDGPRLVGGERACRRPALPDRDAAAVGDEHLAVDPPGEG